MRGGAGRGDRSSGQYKTAVTVRLWVSQAAQRQRSRWLVLAVLTAAVGLVAMGGWLAVQLIVNPGAMGWLSWLSPAQPASGQQPQTLAEITAELRRVGQMPGDAIDLSLSGRSDHAILLPVCQTAPSCTQIVELRVYRLQTPSTLQTATYALIDRLAVAGPEELAAIAPLPHSPLLSQGSTRLLPLTSVTEIAGNAPAAGIWLNISGEWQRGSTQVIYGQVIRYDPAEDQLQPLMVWSSPAGQLPRWQTVSSRQSELVVNQTIGLEPQFQVYQVQSLNLPGRSIQLDAITLNQPACSDRAYQQALVLARSGLWSPALMQLQTYKRQHADRWTAAAQAQLDVVALHAHVTQAQADRDWASPTQQILALLLDGRWSAALNQLRTAHQGGYDIATVLTVNASGIRKRVEAALQVSPQPDLWRWSSLLIAVQQNRSAAIAWLRQQHADPQIEHILALLDLPQPQQPVPAVPASVPTVSLPALIGTASPIDTVNPADWWTANAVPLTLEANQIWYRIQIFARQPDQEPRSLITQANKIAVAPARLWQLADQPLQIMGWANGTPQSVQAIARAVQVHDGELSILAAGDRLPAGRPSIAITSQSLQWLEPTAVASLTALSQQSEWQAMLPALHQELRHRADAAATALTDTEDTDLKAMGDVAIALVDLTGDTQPDAILTLPVDRSAAAHTLILSRQGKVLYSDLQTTNTCLGIVTLSGSFPVLLVDTVQGYQVWHWSAQAQRFQPPA